MPFGSPEVPRIAIAAAGSRIESSLGPVASGTENQVLQPSGFSRNEAVPLSCRTRTDSEDVAMEIVHLLNIFMPVASRREQRGAEHGDFSQPRAGVAG